MAIIPDFQESEVVKKNKQELFDHLKSRSELEPVKLPRLKKGWDDIEISELKQIRTKLRMIIDGDIQGPLTEYERKRQGQLDKKYKYHPDFLIW